MIWVVGCNGMLASDVITAFDYNDFKVLCTDRSVDITDIELVRNYIKQEPETITHIINCSAYTAVDDAEDHEDEAYALNELGAKNLAILANELNATLVHISTDYVFDGESETPYSEDMQPNPIGVYGASKLAGENQIREICPNHYIVRTSWLYGANGNSFVSTMINLMNDRDSLNIVADQWGSPTWTVDLANALVMIVAKNSSDFGTYHFSNSGKTTWYDFAKEIYSIARSVNMIESDCKIGPNTTANYPTKAKRPPFSLLSKEKIVKAFGVPVPEWRDSLQTFLGDN